jgi:hypothetical protein
MIGPGKYDAALSLARAATGGCAILIVVDGKHGSGFACQTLPATMRMIPSLLRQVADDIEADQKAAR